MALVLAHSNVAAAPQVAKVLDFSAALACALLATTALTSSARAHKNGIAVEDCGGCHGGGKQAEVTITPSSPTIGLGQTVRLSVSIQAPEGAVGGLFFRATQGVGKIALVASEPTKLLGGGVTHSAPKSRSGQSVVFAVDWTAPTTPGDVEFVVTALAGNGDGRSTGDASGSGYLSAVFGCTGLPFYPDYDDDGFGGSDALPRLACTKPTAFSASSDDCDNYDERVHPGATETCNKRDDDCDTQVDEALPIREYCEDKDGDGHGVRTTALYMGCAPTKGFGLCDSDCRDDDATIYPSAQELCNYRDDDCNNRVDDNARASCGVGWCRRNSESCDPALCVPGRPVTEVCNLLDDDCDGTIDEGELCGVRELCLEGACVKASTADAGARADGGAQLDASAVRDAAFVQPALLDADVAEQAGSNSAAGCSVVTRLEQRASDLSPALVLFSLLVRARRSRRLR
jgi:hypothetical protein